MKYEVTRDSSNFLAEVMDAVPGGGALRLCLQCGTCGGSCPSGPDMDHTPRSLFAMIQAGLRYQVLHSNTPWYCVACYYCTVRCPQHIPIPELMHALQRLSIREDSDTERDASAFSQAFIANVERYGRNFELGLATRYHLSHHRRELRTVAPMGLDLARKHRVGYRPEKIEHLHEFRAILKRARSLEAAS